MGKKVSQTLAHSLELGDKADKLGTSAAGYYLKLPNITTAQRLAITIADGLAAGLMVYDRTVGSVMQYSGAGWGVLNGTAAASLDAAYNGGSTLTVDTAAVVLDSSLDANVFGIVADSVTTANVVDINADGLTTGTILHLDSTVAGLGAGLFIDCYDGAASAFSVGKYGAVVIAGNAATTVFTITAGNAVMTAGDLTLTSGNVVLTSGNLTLTNGAFTVTAGNVLINGGTTTIDYDNAAAFLIRRNGGGATVFNVDSTMDPGDTAFTLTPTTTTGKGILLTASTTTGQALDIVANAVTTGDALRITVASGTMQATGAAISVIDSSNANREIFAVRDDGTVYAYGAAEGTTAMNVVTGDFVVSDGDITVSSGEVSLTSDANATGLVVTNAVATTASVATITANALTTGTALTLTSTGVLVTTGEMLSVVANSATTATALIRASGTALTTGYVCEFTGGGANIGAAGGVVNVLTGAATTGYGVKITNAAGVYVGTTGVLAVQADAATTGTIVNVSGDGLTTGFGILIDRAGAGLLSGGALFKANMGAGIAGSGFAAVTTGVYTGTDGLLNITAAAATTGVLAVIAAAGLTEGTALKISATEATLTTGKYIDCYDGAASDFAVAKYGATTIAGSASGTASLTQTAGDHVLTAGNIILTNGYIKGTPQAIVNANTAIDVTHLVTTIANNAPSTHTLADGVVGQIKIINCVTYTGDAVITPTNFVGSTITLNAAGDSWTGIFLGTEWVTLSLGGGAVVA